MEKQTQEHVAFINEIKRLEGVNKEIRESNRFISCVLYVFAFSNLMLCLVLLGCCKL